jgi:hypothetical protein
MKEIIAAIKTANAVSEAKIKRRNTMKSIIIAVAMMATANISNAAENTALSQLGGNIPNIEMPKAPSSNSNTRLNNRQESHPYMIRIPDLYGLRCGNPAKNIMEVYETIENVKKRDLPLTVVFELISNKYHADDKKIIKNLNGIEMVEFDGMYRFKVVGEIQTDSEYLADVKVSLFDKTGKQIDEHIIYASLSVPGMCAPEDNNQVNNSNNQNNTNQQSQYEGFDNNPNPNNIRRGDRVMLIDSSRSFRGIVYTVTESPGSCIVYAEDDWHEHSATGPCSVFLRTR